MTLKFAPKFHDLIRKCIKVQTRRPIDGKPPKWVPGEVYDLPEVGVRVLCQAVRSQLLDEITSRELTLDGYDWASFSRSPHDGLKEGLDRFRADWDSFYGVGAFDKNPLVWVYSFKVVTA